MTTYDIISVFQWWLVILFIGIIYLPLTSIIFSRFFDKGYIFSKLLGIALASYTVFLFGILRIIPFGQNSSIFITLLLAIIIYLLLPWKFGIVSFFKANWKIFLLEEIIFLSALFFWSYIHGFNPDIHGLEKYMDFGFINSILRSDYFPPLDMWFPPEPINYYYFGHLITAFLTKISSLPSALTFNIMLSTLFAFCLAQTFSIGANLFYFSRDKIDTKKLKLKLFIAGMLTAILTTLGGNLHIIYAFFEPYKVDEPKPVWELAFNPINFPNSYWYPNATRYIYHTIHEFPVYSWVVADVHGHVLDIPYVLLLIALLLSIFVKADKPDDKNKDTTKFGLLLQNAKIKQFAKLFLLHPLWIALLGFILAIMYMTNAWDGAIYLLLTVFILIYLFGENSGTPKQPSIANKTLSTSTKRTASNLGYILKVWFVNLKYSWGIEKNILNLIPKVLVPIISIFTTFLLFSFPYNLFFKPFASGIGILCSPDFLIKIGKFGPFLFEKDHCQHSYLWELLMLYGFFYFFVILFIIYLNFTKKIRRMDSFVLILIALSTILIILPEFIYVKDIYPGHYRANTMFKLVFQAFIMLSISSVYIISVLSQAKYRIPFLFSSIILIALVMTYPYLAIPSYYGDFKNYKGLNGTTYLNNLYPDDYAAILWLNAYIKGQPVILEAQGDSYTDYARVSANTGLPTVLGWTVHEWLWRGDYSVPAPRITDVATMYESQDLKKTQELLDKYKVEYVFIGNLEKEKYPNLYEDKFASLGKIVYQRNNTKIYKVL